MRVIFVFVSNNNVLIFSINLYLFLRMSSIEELLNSDDSSDDGFDTNVNLEYLLNSKDDHEDDVIDQETKIISECCISINDTISVPAINIEKLIVKDQATLETISDDHVINNQDSQLESVIEDHFAEADNREKSFLCAGKRDIMSALQSKVNSMQQLNYSNVMCDELVTMSSQLRRNSAYKQHGPGAATAIVVGDAFIAVGTAKGLIILFDHDEEIRQVLGSNLAFGTRPSTAVTSIDVPHGRIGNGNRMDALLVCGYASGELAIWDVAKGSILKLISDLHSASVFTVSIIDAISDGFTNINPVAVEHEFTLPEGLTSKVPASAAVPTQTAPQSHSDFSGFLASAASSNLQGVSLVLLSADADGVMYKTRLSKTLWAATYSAESECLLDSSTGPLHGMAVLGPVLQAVQACKSIVCSKISCKYLVAHRSTRMLAINVGPAQTWVVQTHPKIKIIYKWNIPEIEIQAEISTNGGVSCLDWTWVQESGKNAYTDTYINSSSEEGEQEALDWCPLLVRSYGEFVQTLVIFTSGPTFPEVSSGAVVDQSNSSFASKFSTLLSSTKGLGSIGASSDKQHGHYISKFSISHTSSFPGHKIIAVRWVSPSELIIMTVTDIIVTNCKLQVVEQFLLAPSFSMELNLFHSHVATLIASGREPVRLQHSVCGRKLFVLVQETVLRVQIQSFFDLANSLAAKGQWLEALALVIENTRRSPALLASHMTEVVGYIVRYVELAVKHPVVIAASDRSSRGAPPSVVRASAQVKNHYHLVAGVCIEYCVACGRLDILFTHVYPIFQSTLQQVVFLEALEPFILSREIQTLPPGVIAEFCESALRSQRLPSLERCVVYFDVSSLDINFLTKFLYENRMYSSFLYVFSNGLGDFPGAFQSIFHFMLPGIGLDSNVHYSNGEDSLVEVGYKLLLFLSYTFDNKVFPRGDTLSICNRAVSLQLLELITSETLCQFPTFFAPLNNSKSADVGKFPYLKKLGAIDHAALMAQLRKGISLLQECVRPEHSDAVNDAQLVSDTLATSITFSLPNLYEYILAYSTSVEADQPDAVRTFYNCFIELISHCPCKLTASFMTGLIDDMASRPPAERCYLEAWLSALVENQGRAAGHLHASQLRCLLRDHSFWLASLSSAKGSAVTEKEEILREQVFGVALEYYLGQWDLQCSGKPDANRSIPQVFQYIDTAFTVVEAVFPAEERKKYEESLSGEILKILVPLGKISLPLTEKLSSSQLCAYVPGIIENTTTETRLQFHLLHALISNPDELLASRISKLTTYFNEKSVAVYMNLLATYEPNKVLEFLRIFEFHYSVDDSLSICRQKGISEAVSFLMERTGEVLDALVMLLKDFSVKLKQVRRDVDAQIRAELAAQAAATKAKVRISCADSDQYVVSSILSKQGSERAVAAMRLPGYKVLLSVINCAADLCARHSQTGQISDQSGMWLIAFDHLLMERRKNSLWFKNIEFYYDNYFYFACIVTETVRSGTASSSGEVVVVLIGLMLQALLAQIGNFSLVTPQEIIRRVTAQGNAAGIRLGEVSFESWKCELHIIKQIAIVSS